MIPLQSISDASEFKSTNSVRVDLTGWIEPDGQAPDVPVIPNGNDLQATYYDKSRNENDLPKTGEIFRNNLFLNGLNMIIFALVAFIYKKRRIKNEKNIISSNGIKYSGGRKYKYGGRDY